MNLPMSTRKNDKNETIDKKKMKGKKKAGEEDTYRI